jgi:sulfate transport system permease protein
VWRVTLPAVRFGLIYGVVLTTARVIGEFGAVAVVSGNIAGQSQTMTLYVEDRFQEFDLVGAYSASVLLACISIATVVVLRLLNRRGVQ